MKSCLEFDRGRWYYGPLKSRWQNAELRVKTSIYCRSGNFRVFEFSQFLILWLFTKRRFREFLFCFRRAITIIIFARFLISRICPHRQNAELRVKTSIYCRSGNFRVFEFSQFLTLWLFTKLGIREFLFCFRRAITIIIFARFLISRICPHREIREN